MASGNSWQLYQELGSHERLPGGDTSTKQTNINKSKSFSHRDTKREHLAKRAISLRAAKKIGQKWLRKARSFLHENEQGGSLDSIETTNGFATASEYSEEDFVAFYDAETELSKVSFKSKKRPDRISLPYSFVDRNCPVHGRAALRKNRSMSTAEGYSKFFYGDEHPFSRNFNESDLIAKLARKHKRATLTPENREKNEKEKGKIIRNLLVISFAFLFLISAFQGLQNLQVSINQGYQGLGSISLSTIYVGLVVSCLFSPPYLMNRLGCKLTLIVSMSMYSMYMLINFIPKWYSMIPGSILLGFAAAPLWAAKCTYLSETGVRYAELNFESPNVVIVRFFGIFFMIVHLGQVFGNLISSYLLSFTLDPKLLDVVDQVDDSCGHFFTAWNNLSTEASKRLSRPESRSVLSVYGVYFCCTIVAILIITLFLNTLKKDVILKREKPRFKLEMWQKTLEHMKKPRHLLLIPLTIFNGMEQAFVAGEFTKAYVGCCLGIHNIGYVMTCFGTCDAVCSVFFGPLIKLFGRMPLFMFGAVVDMLMIFTLLIWPPNPADTALFYVVAAAWGMADAVWNTQINGLWVILFAQNLEVAFANYRLWESIGFIIGFSTIPYVSTESKLYILLAVLVVGMFGYGLIEVWEPLEVYSKRIQQKMNTFQPRSILKRSRQENYPLAPLTPRSEMSFQFSVDNPASSVHM